MYPAITQKIEKPVYFPIPSFGKPFNLNESAPQIISPVQQSYLEMIKPLNFSEPFV